MLIITMVENNLHRIWMFKTQIRLVEGYVNMLFAGYLQGLAQSDVMWFHPKNTCNQRPVGAMPFISIRERPVKIKGHFMKVIPGDTSGHFSDACSPGCVRA